MSYDEHLISQAGGDGGAGDFYVDFGEPDPVISPRTYTEAEMREAKAAALEEAAAGWSDWDALHAPEDWLRARAAAVRGGE